MEQPFKNEEDIIRTLVQESRLESPSANFSKSIMEKIEVNTTVTAVRPLLSTSGWVAFVAFLIAGSVLLYLYPIDKVSLADRLVDTLHTYKTSTPSLHVSRGAQYAFLFLALFLIQIPFLKRFLDKQRT
ncbi:hypothetical protein G5B37_13790 [Rasiella rasia]|uniref:Uncharacterized protein n=1 Tax=Rasiella rasia TaxID=2744027 RepID=A0A6G6GPT3_9FLAO|nr:hypothetical protein [Rasiella rasia]QIE60596.1 hypothetical protein G5B37_13790 [Rasiella rasia]